MVYGQSMENTTKTNDVAGLGGIFPSIPSKVFKICFCNTHRAITHCFLIFYRVFKAHIGLTLLIFEERFYKRERNFQN
jgi:hypothetical protein